MTLLLDTNNGQIELGDNTLLFAFDDTGHEEFKDEQYQVYGIGGCACLVKDYYDQIEAPFNYMCANFFPKIKRPFHTTDVSRDITPDQIEALNHLFERFLFFRLARTITINSKNEAKNPNIDIITSSLLNAIKYVADLVLFDRIFVIFEDSDRTGALVMNGLSNKSLDDGHRKTRIELGLMAKKALSPALELADVIVHTAGRSARKRMQGEKIQPRDFESVFTKIDKRLSSHLEIIRIEDS